jgi:lysophospholipase L1-like esterase
MMKPASLACDTGRTARIHAESVRRRVVRIGAALGLAASLGVVGCGEDEGSDSPEIQSGGLNPNGAGGTGQGGTTSGPASTGGAAGASTGALPSGGTEGSLPDDIPLGAGGVSSPGASADAGADAGADEVDGGAPPTPPDPNVFAPCPTDGTVCKIMPLGDSITFGIASSDGAGYRLDLFEQAVADGHAVTLVGRVQAGPSTTVQGQQFPTNNEGYSGATISTGMNQLADRVDAALAANPPHIVLLQIGTNNLYQGMAPEVPGQLASLLDQITTDAPEALVVVAQITPLAEAGAQLTFPANGVDEYNALIPGIVQERVDTGQHLLLVNMNAAFRAANANVAALLADGIHPTDTGYGVMAQTWYAAIESLLP